MSITDSILYGILQGVAEFLPISSSGHLAILHAFLGDVGETSAAFDVMLHMATLLAVVAVYGNDLLNALKGFFTLIKKLFCGRIKEGLDNGERLFLMLCVASLPLIPAAFADDYILGIRSRLWLIGVLLIINGIMLFLADRMKEGNITLGTLTCKNAFMLGIVQLFAVMPGISRSGATVTGGISAGLTRDDAVKFSFLMSVPAILGASVLELPSLFSKGVAKVEILPLLIGALTAFFVGIAAIRLLKYTASKKKFGIFTVYCIAIGLTAIVYDVLK